MMVRDLKVGDRVENYRIRRIWVITEIGGYHGDEISLTELRSGLLPYRRKMTFKQFERLKFLRFEGDRR